MPKTDGESRSCWRRIVRKHGLTQDGKKSWEETMHKWYEWLERMKKKDEKEKWRRCISERWRRLSRVQKGVLDSSTKSRSQRCGVE